MDDLFWPGDSRAGNLFSDSALIRAMITVEAGWRMALGRTGLAEEGERNSTSRIDTSGIADRVEAGGNPVIPLVDILRDLQPGEAAKWVHRGLTSQDTLDSALMLCVRDVLDRVVADMRRQVAALRDLADAHRESVQAGRTLTQWAVPTTFGLTAANWLSGVLDAAGDLVAVRGLLPVQVGGAAGTLAAPVSLAGSVDTARRLVDEFAEFLQLMPAPPWHTNRRPITRIGDALVGCVDAWGRIANDVLVRTRPEIAELAEATPGGSSTMPQKQNPVLSVLIKRAAISAPFLAAQLHAAAAAAVDERPDGAWHAEWAPLRTLGRLAVVAGSQTADLLDGLDVRTERMAATAAAAADALLAEQRAMTGRSGELTEYLGATDALIDNALARAGAFLAEEER
jgi:3-carboxy-cis,cis-muconate cycloisomerase